MEGKSDRRRGAGIEWMTEDREAGVGIERGIVIKIETEAGTGEKVAVEVVKGEGAGPGVGVEVERKIDGEVEAGIDRGGEGVIVGRDVEKEVEVLGMTEGEREVQTGTASSELCLVAS